MQQSQSTIIREIAEERLRQIQDDGFRVGNNYRSQDKNLARAAASYCLSSAGDEEPSVTHWPKTWPFHMYEPSTQRLDLIRAAALILAAIECIDRNDERKDRK